MTLTFTWLPDYNTSGDKTPNTKAIAFGDGYEQRQDEGLNPIKQMWPVSFSKRETTETDAIDAFLTARGAKESFFWTPPRQSVPLKFVCRKWQYIPVAGNLNTITGTFEQVYEA